MRVIIETDETDLAGIYFKLNENKVEWQNIDKEDQQKIINAMTRFTKLFEKFIKP